MSKEWHSQLCHLSYTQNINVFVYSDARLTYKKTNVIFCICPRLAPQLCQSSSDHPLNSSSGTSPLSLSQAPWPPWPLSFRYIPVVQASTTARPHRAIMIFKMHQSPPLTLNAMFVETVSSHLCFGCIQFKGTVWRTRKNMLFMVKLSWVQS